MRELQRKIKNLELVINRNNQRIYKDYCKIKGYVESPIFMLLGVGGSLIFGFILARKKTVLEVLRFFMSLSFRTRKFQAKLKLLSYFIR